MALLAVFFGVAFFSGAWCVVLWVVLLLQPCQLGKYTATACVSGCSGGSGGGSCSFLGYGERVVGKLGSFPLALARW